MLRGERSGVRYQLAGRVRVKVVRVNLEQAKIDFVLSGEIPWRDTRLAQAPTLHLGGSRSQMALAESEIAAGRHAEWPMVLAALPHVADVRQAGMIVAFELMQDRASRTPFDPARRIGLHAYRAALERGVVLRPLGDVLYWMPPYCIDEAQLALLAETTRAAIIEATACA